MGRVGTVNWDGNGYRRRLPDQWTIRLLYPRPIAGLSANDRVHYRVKARNTATIREQVSYMVRAAKVPQLERICVDVTWYVTDSRVRDSDNLAPWLKVIYDAIGSSRGVSAHIVKDDSPKYMVKPEARIERAPGKGAAFFEIRITDLGGAA